MEFGWLLSLEFSTEGKTSISSSLLVPWSSSLNLKWLLDTCWKEIINLTPPKIDKLWLLGYELFSHVIIDLRRGSIGFMPCVRFLRSFQIETSCSLHALLFLDEYFDMESALGLRMRSFLACITTCFGTPDSFHFYFYYLHDPIPYYSLSIF